LPHTANHHNRPWLLADNALQPSQPHRQAGQHGLKQATPRPPTVRQGDKLRSDFFNLPPSTALQESSGQGAVPSSTQHCAFLALRNLHAAALQCLMAVKNLEAQQMCVKTLCMTTLSLSWCEGVRSNGERQRGSPSPSPSRQQALPPPRCPHATSSDRSKQSSQSTSWHHTQKPATRPSPGTPAHQCAALMKLQVQPIASSALFFCLALFPGRSPPGHLSPSHPALALPPQGRKQHHGAAP